MKRPLTLALIFAVPIELLNFFLIEPPFVPDTSSWSWFEKALSSEWWLIHDPGLYLAYILRFEGHLERATWFLFGYIDTVVLIYPLAILARGGFRLMVKQSRRESADQASDSR